MRPLLVVVSTPFLHLRARIVKRQEPAGVQALAAQLAVKRLDEGIVRRLSGSAEVERHVIGIGPEVEIAGNELRSLDNPDDLRVADPAADPVQGRHDVLGPIAEARIDDG